MKDRMNEELYPKKEFQIAEDLAYTSVFGSLTTVGGSALPDAAVRFARRH